MRIDHRSRAKVGIRLVSSPLLCQFYSSLLLLRNFSSPLPLCNVFFSAAESRRRISSPLPLCNVFFSTAESRQEINLLLSAFRIDNARLVLYVQICRKLSTQDIKLISCRTLHTSAGTWMKMHWIASLSSVELSVMKASRLLLVVQNRRRILCLCWEVHWTDFNLCLSLTNHKATELVHENRNGTYQWIVKPKTVQYEFKTGTRAPKLGVMLVGWGGNNGSTLTAGVIANQE
ncbi:hypothetical protein NE237_022352 [Protea cynaroides]|uniref:Inositol-3-phosphate synthase n=1 Tax=Protea cynaroides TaxID=273540 RepID=A0A9Q0HA81_9MAGN|nr:hypothetical protein NE237_022352 [Protea cynaroides]